MILIPSPIYSNEFGDEVVARLAGIDGSIPPFFQDKPIGSFFSKAPHVVNSCHIFCSARIVYLVRAFNLRDSAVAIRTWSLLRYVLSTRSMLSPCQIWTQFNPLFRF